MLPATKVLIECSTRLERFQFSLSITIKAHINKAVRKTNKPVNKYKYHYIADDIILDIPKTYFYRGSGSWTAKSETINCTYLCSYYFFLIFIKHMFLSEFSLE